VSWGVGGVGVLATTRVLGIWEDGGGVMEAAGGAGEVNLAWFDGPGEPGDEVNGKIGVAGRDISVEGIRESWESWDKDGCGSILPGRKWPEPRATRQNSRRGAGAGIEGASFAGGWAEDCSRCQ
jgi:hypothetical protein